LANYFGWFRGGNIGFRVEKKNFATVSILESHPFRFEFNRESVATGNSIRQQFWNDSFGLQPPKKPSRVI